MLIRDSVQSGNFLSRDAVCTPHPQTQVTRTRKNKQTKKPKQKPTNQNHPVWMKLAFPMVETILLSSHGPFPHLIVDLSEKETLTFSSFQNGISLKWNVDRA